MVEEAYCNPEIAELLKEKEMDKECFTHYIQKNNSDGTSEAVTTCTQQRAMRWLREKYRLFVNIEPLSGIKYTWSIWFMNESKESESSLVYDTYEQACEAGIKYCLEHLI